MTSLLILENMSIRAQRMLLQRLQQQFQGQVMDIRTALKNTTAMTNQMKKSKLSHLNIKVENNKALNTARKNGM